MRLDLMINTMTHRALTTGRISVTGGEAWRPHVHVRDVATAFLMAAEAPHDRVTGEVFNVGSDHNNFTISEAAVMVAAEIPDTQIDYLDTVEDLRSYRVSFDKVRHVLGFTANYRIEDGVREVRELLTSAVIDGGDSVYSNLKHLREHGFGGTVHVRAEPAAADSAAKHAAR
jgi:nucleoside-diphosphate-sugar epimerase